MKRRATAIYPNNNRMGQAFSRWKKKRIDDHTLVQVPYGLICTFDEFCKGRICSACCELVGSSTGFVG